MNRIARLGLLTLLALGVTQSALAESVTITGKVVSVRAGQAYVELQRPVRVKIGARIELVKEQRVTSAVVAVSTKWLVVKVPEGLELASGDSLQLTVNVRPARAGGDEPAEDVVKAPVQLGGKPLSADAYREQLPEFGKVPFRNLSLPEQDSDMARKGETGEADPDAPRPPDGGTPRPDGEGPAEEDPQQDLPPSNDVHGELEIGFDSASDDDLGIDRVTPFGRLRFEVRRLGGSDRTRLFFYGSVRHALDGNKDWTGHHEEDLVARVSAAVLEVDAVPEEQVQGFTDRIELGIGRDTIPGLVQAGLVDGLRLGLRFGSFTVYGFGGGGGSPNPHREDYDSVIYGGGVRFNTSVTHVGSFYFSVGGAQERFRNEGERDFIEGTAGMRLGSFGLDATAVVDLFDQLRDKSKTYLSYGSANLYWQLGAPVRFEVGYREIRPAYHGDLVSAARLNNNVPDPAVAAAFAAANQAPSDLDPLVAGFLERSERRNAWGAVVLRLGSTWTIVARGDHNFSPESRDSTGGYVSLTKNKMFTNDRFSVEGSATHRLRGSSILRHSTDVFGQVRYLWFGESVDWGLALYYRTTLPEELGDSRFGGRMTFDADLTDWLELHLYGSFESPRIAGGTNEVFFAGASFSAHF